MCVCLYASVHVCALISVGVFECVCQCIRSTVGGGVPTAALYALFNSCTTCVSDLCNHLESVSEDGSGRTVNMEGEN